MNFKLLIKVTEFNRISISATNAISGCNFKIEKRKLPTFSGNISEYAMFKSDFKHIVHTKYSKKSRYPFESLLGGQARTADAMVS